ncbi:Mitogen activated protein kinase kinase kinase [Rhynchospora pubera]|uniref:mitogen-activated protein kinase kinase kinase n=1 Tax=Rhynchospora pubera TaxID=906938 RepID=A0AAV8CL71_9POAL|nr:Mitogen activated protein kinase kinase kinase [Rhynchospora pubera]
MGAFFWRKGAKSKSKSKSKSNPSSSASSPRKKPWFFPESPSPNKISHTSSDPSPIACAHPLPRPISLPESVTGSGSSSLSCGGSGDDAPDFVIDGYPDANTQREKKVVSVSQRIPYVPPEEKNRRYSEASVSPRASDFVPLASDVSTSYGINLRGSNLLSPPTSRRHQHFSLSPVHPELRSAGSGQIDGLRSPPHPLPLPPGSPNGLSGSGLFVCSGSGSNKSEWQKGKLLGRGTFGQVYQGFNREGGHMCAIKEVTVVSDDKNSKECLRQLNHEIVLLSQLKHPNIVRYYGSELTDDRLSVFLEYVSGGSIHKLIQEYGSFNEPVIRNYTRQILSGLAYLHGRNTVHRDIKGANILVGTNGEVKLADFGMAKHTSSYNAIKSLKGSPYWIAPEVVMNANGYDLSVDIWSLGCTVIEMATSKPPWSQFEGVAALFKIANSKDIPEIPDHLSPDGKNFLRLCLRRDPVTRPTAAQLLEHPFVLEQPVTRISSPKHSTSPAAVSPKAREFHSRRSISPLRDIDVKFSGRDIPGFPSFYSPNNLKTCDASSMRANMSLPVSPCSSPLRQPRNSNTNCLPSPSHPYYAPVVPVNHSPQFNHATSPMRSSGTVHTTDPWHEMAQLKIQSPYGSPKRF